MKKLTWFFATFLFVLQYSAQAQEVQHTAVTSFSIRPGFFMVAAATTVEDYNNLKSVSNAPSSVFIDALQYSSNTQMSGSGNAAFRVDIGLTPYCKKKGKLMENREIRFSIGADAGVRRNFIFYKREYLTDDTLFNNEGEPVMIQHKVSLDQHNYAENFVNLSVGVSYLFKTDTKKRLHLYAGVGMEYAVSIRSILKTYAYNDTTDEYNLTEYAYGYWGSGMYNYYRNGTSTKYKMTGASHFIRGYLPAGIDFRFSNGNNFFRHVHLFSEIQPGVELQITNGVSMVNPYMGFVIAGLSYKW